MTKSLLERALDAEDRAEAAEKRCAELTRRLAGAIGMDPTTAVAALSWVTRAEVAEKLLADLMRFIDQRAIDTRDFPGGWVTRVQAQLKAVEITMRDLPKVDRPADDDYWLTEVDRVERIRRIARERRRKRS